jgi:hypothetical protein
VQRLSPVTPTGESSVMQTLVAFQAYVTEKYAPKTAKMYWGDVREVNIRVSHPLKMDSGTPYAH